jgi:hypothetical protein
MPNRMQTKLRSPLSAGVAQLVERQPSKLNVASSSLVSRSVSFLDFGAPTPKSTSYAAGACLDSGALTRSVGVSFQFRRVRRGPLTDGQRFATSFPAAESATRQTTPSSAGPLPLANRKSSTTSKQAPRESSSQMRSVSREPERSVLGTRAPEAQGHQADGRDLARSPRLELVVSSNAHLAQLVEHVLGKDEVTSSILVVGSKQTQSRERRASPRITAATTVH